MEEEETGFFFSMLRGSLPHSAFAISYHYSKLSCRKEGGSREGQDREIKVVSTAAVSGY